MQGSARLVTPVQPFAAVFFEAVQMGCVWLVTKFACDWALMSKIYWDDLGVMVPATVVFFLAGHYKHKFVDWGWTEFLNLCVAVAACLDAFSKVR